MIVNLEPSEAEVLKMELSEHAIEKWLKEPAQRPLKSSSARRRGLRECVGADAFVRPASNASVSEPKFLPNTVSQFVISNPLLTPTPPNA